MNTQRKSPGAWEDEAIAAAGRGEYEQAAELFSQAAGACIGHGRAEGYKEAAERMRKMAQDAK